MGWSNAYPIHQVGGDGWEGEGEWGLGSGGLMHTQFISWVGIFGRRKVGRDWGGQEWLGVVQNMWQYFSIFPKRR